MGKHKKEILARNCYSIILWSIAKAYLDVELLVTLGIATGRIKGYFINHQLFHTLLSSRLTPTDQKLHYRKRIITAIVPDQPTD